jgi:uncharacterized protein
MLHYHRRSLSFALMLCWLAACGSPSPASIPIPVVTTNPTLMVESSPTTQPTLSAIPATPTNMPTPTRPPEPTLAATGAQLVRIPTANGSTILAEQLGSGSSAVLFAVMGNCAAGWTALAEETAKQGFLVVTYRWQACEGTRINQATLRSFVDDARTVIQFVRDQGATQIILVGASLGGCASAKLLAEVQADGLVVIAAPSEIPDWGFQITADDLKSSVPKLFITAEDDSTVPASATRALYELAAEPRTWQTYPGSAHGTDLFTTDQEPVLQKQILDFLRAIAKT